MSEHTKEPWKASKKFALVLSADEEFVASCICLEPEDWANAHRIVACVNACCGIPTDRLEDVATGKRVIMITPE